MCLIFKLGIYHIGKSLYTIRCILHYYQNGQSKYLSMVHTRMILNRGKYKKCIHLPIFL